MHTPLPPTGTAYGLRTALAPSSAICVSHRAAHHIASERSAPELVRPAPRATGLCVVERGSIVDLFRSPLQIGLARTGSLLMFLCLRSPMSRRISSAPNAMPSSPSLILGDLHAQKLQVKVCLVWKFRMRCTAEIYPVEGCSKLSRAVPDLSKSSRSIRAGRW